MIRYEYKTVAAPRRAKRFKGVKGQPDCFARTIEEALSAEAVDGWEYFRAEHFPCEEKSGIFRRGEDVFHSCLIFRREVQHVDPRLTADPSATIQPAPQRPALSAMPGPATEARLRRAGAGNENGNGNGNGGAKSEPYALRADMQLEPAGEEASPQRLGPATS